MISSKTTRRGYLAALIVMAAGSLVLRFVDLSADPPLDFGSSAGDFLDGQTNAHTARSYVRFGKWRPDDWDPYVYSPTYVLLQIPWFKLFGTDLRAINAFGATASVLTLIVALLLCRRWGRLGAGLAILLFGCDFLLLHFGRTGLFENVMMLFMLGSIAALATTNLSPYRAGLAGGLAMLAYATKGIAIYFLPAPIVGVALAATQVWLGGARRRAGTICLGFAAGTALVAIPWFVLFAHPNSAEIAKFATLWRSMAIPASLPAILNEVGTMPLFFQLGLPGGSIANGYHVRDLLLHVALISAGVALYRTLTRPREASPAAAAFSVWLLGGAALLATFKYTPTRYYVPLLPAILCLSIYGLTALCTTGSVRIARPRCWWWADLIGLFVLTVLVRFDLAYRISLDGLLSGRLPRVWDKLLICAVIAALLWAIARGVTRWHPVTLPRWLRLGVTAAILLHFTVGNLAGSYHWWRDRHHSIVDTGRALAKYDNVVVGGTSVLSVVTENRHTAVRIGKPGWYNDEDPFTRFGLTHLLLTDYGGEVRRFQSRYPKQMAEARVLEAFRICHWPYHLYELSATAEAIEK